jgi:hypothetical protein
MPNIIYIAEVCERYGWDYQQYFEQPQFFLDAIAVKLSTEARIERKRMRQLERRNRMSGI